MKTDKLTESQFLFKFGMLCGVALKHNELTAEEAIELKDYVMDLLAHNDRLSESND